MSDENLFGELRSLLQRPPSLAAWDHLCLALEEWPAGALEEQALPYVRSIVSRWPDALRAASPRWIKAFVLGRKIPWLGLAKSVSFHGTRLTAEAMLKALDMLAAAELVALDLHNAVDTHHPDTPKVFDHVALSSLRKLSASHVWASGEALAAALASPRLERLERLELGSLYGDHVFDGVSRVLGSDAPRLLPALRELRLHWIHSGGPIYAGLVALVPMGQLTRLELHQCNAHHDALRKLLGPTPLKALRALSLRGSELAPAALDVIDELVDVRALEELELTSARGEEEALLRGLTRLDLNKLRSLDLGATAVSTRGVMALREHAPAGLESLAMTCTYASAESLETLLTSPVGAQLKHVTLRGLRELGVDVARALSVAGELPALETLDLSGARLGQRGAALLSRANLPQLKVLRLNQCDLDGPSLEALCQAPWAQGLERLEAQRSLLDGASARGAMAHVGRLRGLRALDLRWCNLGPSGGLTLARAEGLRQLEELELHGNQLGMSALEALLRAPWLGGLRRLGLEQNNLDDEAARAVAGCAALWGLEHLGLSESHLITRSGELALDASPHLNTLAWPRKHAEEPLRRQRSWGPQSRAEAKAPTVRKRST